MTPASPSSSSDPWRMTAMRSAIAATTSRSCEMNSMAMPRLRRTSRSRASTCACVVTSSAVVGSSAISSVGSPARTIAIIARCCWPPDSSKGRRSSMRTGSGKPTSCSSSAARVWRSRRSRPAGMVSTICAPRVISGLSALMGSWNTMPIWRPRTVRHAAGSNAVSSRPRRRMLPATCGWPGASPSTASAVIDLPLPDSPISPRVSPSRMSSETSRTTGVSP